MLTSLKPCHEVNEVSECSGLAIYHGGLKSVVVVLVTNGD